MPRDLARREEFHRRSAHARNRAPVAALVAGFLDGEARPP